MDQSRKLRRSEDISLLKAETFRHKIEIDAAVRLARQQLGTSHELLAQLDEILNAGKNKGRD